MIYFQFNKFKKFNHQIDLYFFSCPREQIYPHINGVLTSSIFKSSLLNNKSVIISENLIDEVELKEDKMILFQENLIYLSYKIKKLLPENIEFQSLSELKAQLFNFQAKNLQH
jgi:hypothetical protein